MKTNTLRLWRSAALVAALLLVGALLPASAEILGMDPTFQGANGPTFHLTARCDFISTPDGNSILIWGYAPGKPEDGNRAQYPGPTLIVNEGEQVTIVLHNRITDEQGNQLAVNTSMMFPGHVQLDVTNDPGVPGLLTREALPGGAVRYRFNADHAGTYLYHSGTEPQLQVEMGLLGALIVRPSDPAFPPLPTREADGTISAPGHAYDSADSAFEREYLFLLTEMDQDIHFQVETGDYDQIDFSSYFPVYWFINGRAAPDTLAPAGDPFLPTQPYNCVPRAMPGERLLLRIATLSRDMHPFHHHGNHSRVIAIDGRLLESAPGAGADLSYEVFTIPSVPMKTTDAIFQWTGRALGWDIYGNNQFIAAGIPHECNDLVENRTGSAAEGDPDNICTGDCYDDTTWEYCPDHGKGIPVVLPGLQSLTFGGFYSGSPFLGGAGDLPVGEGGLNPNNGLFFIWHSHTEKELTNFDIFPGGLLTMMAVEPPGTTDIP